MPKRLPKLITVSTVSLDGKAICVLRLASIKSARGGLISVAYNSRISIRVVYSLGEDRWMCTLMVQRGWRLSYCAAAEDSTYCPESFEEFYKQRRRWTPSTLANLVLLVSQWKQILKNNEHISFLFILYQTFLVCSTVIG